MAAYETCEFAELEKERKEAATLALVAPAAFFPFEVF